MQPGGVIFYPEKERDIQRLDSIFTYLDQSVVKDFFVCHELLAFIVETVTLHSPPVGTFEPPMLSEHFQIPWHYLQGFGSAN